MKTQHKIIIGDSRRMKEIPDESVHFVVTSPPYWQLKDYGNGKKQIGFHDSYEEYINNLNLIWDECHRVLHDGCRLCVRFLKEKTGGQKVFMKLDEAKYDRDNNLLCYLYLWNKTFLNAHLIKSGFVGVDVSVAFKYRSKFLSLYEHSVQEAVA